jgi:intracellular multiplication protein IcmT
MAASVDAHWRDSARPVKFFIWDGRASFPVVIFLMHMTLWTLFLTIFLIVFFTILNRFGFTPIVFFRWMRNLIAGRRKMAIPWWMS